MATIKVMSAGAVEGPVSELAPEFTRASGHEVELAFNTVGAHKERFVQGEKTDIIILSFPVIEALDREGRFAAGSRADLGRASCGVAVRDGMMMPNIATLEGFKRMLKFAVSIAANDPAHGGSSGIYLADLLKRMGLSDEVSPKLKLYKTGRECALALVRGEAEIGITFTSEFFAVPGTRVVGPFPKEIEYVNGYAGAIPKDAAVEPAGLSCRFFQAHHPRNASSRSDWSRIGAHAGGFSMPRIVSLLFGLAVSLSTVVNAETLKVAVAQRGFWDSTMVDIAEKQGFFKEAGLEIEVLYTEGGASTLTPVLAGSIDIAMSNGFLGVIGAFSKGAPVRVISAEGTGASDAFWYARTESGIKSLKETNGKTVAFSSPGSSTNLILLQLVKAAGASPKLVPTGGAPATYTQVMTGQIDVGWSVPPFALKDLQEKKIAIIARGSDAPGIGGQTVRVNVANANALKQKREAFVKYVKALGRAVDWAYSSPDALSNYAAIAKVPVDQAKMTREDFYPKESLQLAEIKGIDITLQQALDFKYITKPMTKEDVAPLFDMLAGEKR